MAKKTSQVHCDKCAIPRGLPIKATKIQAKCDICGKNKLCSEIPLSQLKKDSDKKTPSKKSTPNKETSKKNISKKSIGENIISILKGAGKGMTADHIISAFPKSANAGSIKSAITRGVKKGDIKKLKTKIKSTDGKMETAYSIVKK